MTLISMEIIIGIILIVSVVCYVCLSFRCKHKRKVLKEVKYNKEKTYAIYYYVCEHCHKIIKVEHKV